MTDHIYLAHHGIKGMKWGVRRFQNADGSLTSAGKSRYGSGTPTKRQVKKDIKAARRAYRKQTGEWMTTGKNVAAVDKKVSGELKNNARRNEVAAERERVGDFIESQERKLHDENNRIGEYDEALDSQQMPSTAREAIISERTRSLRNAQVHRDNLDIANERYDRLTEEYESIGRETARKYYDEYKRAVVADLGYEDISAGVALLDSYGLTNYALRWDIYRRNG